MDPLLAHLVEPPPDAVDSHEQIGQGDIHRRRHLDQWKPGEHNGTFRGNNHAFVTATVALEHFWREPAFSSELERKARYLRSRLQALVDRFSPEVEEVRGRGLMQGVRFRDPKRAKAAAARAFEHGLLIERSGSEDEVVKCMMPLTITTDEIKEGLDILERSFLEVLRDGVVEKSPLSGLSPIRVLPPRALGA